MLSADCLVTYALLENASDSEIHLPYPSPCTVMDALLWYVDITSLPKKNVLENLYSYATTDEDKKLLTHFMEDHKVPFCSRCSVERKPS